MTSERSARRGPRGAYAKSAQRREEIAAAARGVFTEKGFHGASLREIAQEAGVSVTTLVHHFPTKTDLLLEVLESSDYEGYEMIGDVDTIGIGATILRIVQRNLTRPEMLRLLAVLSAEATDDTHPAHAWFAGRYEELIGGIATYIAHDQQAGRIGSTRDPRHTAHVVAAVWDGLQLQWLLNPKVDMLARMSEALGELLQPADHALTVGA